MIKKFINFFLNLIMSVLVLSFILICLISNTLFNKEYIKNKMIENKFYDRAYLDIKEDFENYTMQSGLELEILDNLFTKDKVTKDINDKLDSIYNGKEISIDTSSIKNELDNRINSALEKNNRIPSDSEKESISKYEDAIIESYNSGILYGANFSIKENQLSNICRIVIISIVINSLILIIINRSFLKYISFIGINLLFSGIIFLGIKVLLENKAQHILILDSKFSNLIVNTITDIFQNILSIGIISCVIGIVLICIGCLEKFKKTIENKNN